MIIGDKLVKFREEAGLSRKEVAQILNVAVPTLGHWETDVNEPSLDKIKQMCELYKRNISELVGEDPGKPLSIDTKNYLLEKVVDMLYEEGSLSKDMGFTDLDESNKKIIIAIIDKYIVNIGNNKNSR